MSAPTRLPPRPVKLPGHGVLLAADAYGDEGAPPVVLLHGGGQTRHAWGSTARRLGEEGWYALTVDLRGHGESDWSPDGYYDVERFAADVASAVAEFAPRTVLVGASLGGISSLVAVADSDPPLARALVLVDITPRIERTGAERIGAFMRHGATVGYESLDEAADAVADYNPHRPRPNDTSGLRKNLRLRDDGRWYWHWDPKFMRPPDSAGGYSPYDRLAEAARKVTVPTLLVRGALSDVVSEDGVRELLSLVPHAEVVDVAGAGHMVAGDRNDPFTEAVFEFLARLD